MSESDTRTGSCLCGAIRYAIRGATESSACHCGMCRRWTGGPLLSVNCEDLRWEGEPTFYQASEWAERGFCSQCGSSLFWRITSEGKYQGVTSVTLGSLDDQEGLPMVREWFIDKKPSVYALAGERKCITEEEAFAMLAQH